MNYAVNPGRLLRAILALGATALLVSTLAAQEIDCAECHEDVSFASPAHPDLVCRDCHTNVTAEHKGADLDTLTDEESCNECHGSVQRAIGRSAHGGEAGCNDCHGAHDVLPATSPGSPECRHARWATPAAKTAWR